LKKDYKKEDIEKYLIFDNLFGITVDKNLLNIMENKDF